MEDKHKKRELALYLACGAITTVISWACMFGVNIICFGSPQHPAPWQNAILSAVNWVSGMSSAYVLNRLLVFRSHEKIWPEFAKFTVSRLSTLGVDQALRQLMGLAGVDIYVTTAVLTVLITVLNYIVSKLAVFRNNNNMREEGHRNGEVC